jgi:aspartate aminotransferase-like enzyme
MKKIRLYTPGPCAVPEEVLLEMARPFEHHRTSWFKEILGSATKRLQQVMCTQNEVIIITGSGTAAAEAAILGCNPPGSKMLTIEGGKFGERWGEIAQQFALPVTRHKVEWGHAVEPAAVEELLKKDPAITCVMLTHSETSTATLCDLQAIAKITNAHGKLLLADCITSSGCLPVKPDEWGVDVVISGSQKAFMMPPGLAFLSISPRAWKTIETNKAQHSYYLNLNAARKAAAKSDTPYTPAHLLVRGLNKACEILLEDGMEGVWKRVASMAAATRAAGEAVGLKVFSKRPSDSVTAFEPPAGIDPEALRKDMKARFGIQSAGGQDHLTGKIFRIGHMGYLDALDAISAVAAMEQSLLKAGHKFALGAGLAAAQKVFAERGV